MLGRGSAAARGRKLSALRLYIEFDGKPNAVRVSLIGRICRVILAANRLAPPRVRLISFTHIPR
jgi:hypothetical protein